MKTKEELASKGCTFLTGVLVESAKDSLVPLDKYSKDHPEVLRRKKILEKAVKPAREGVVWEMYQEHNKLGWHFVCLGLFTQPSK